MSHEDGASTEVTGTFVSSSAWMTLGNGSRISPEKLNPALDVSVHIYGNTPMATIEPKIASTI